MSTKPFWEVPLKAITSFSERLVGFEQLDSLPWGIRKPLTRCFWIYHYAILAFMIMEKNEILDSGTTIIASYPLILFYCLYLIHFILIYIPFGVLSSLYLYLKNRDIPPSNSILISLLTVIGGIFLCWLVYKL